MTSATLSLEHRRRGPSYVLCCGRARSECYCMLVRVVVRSGVELRVVMCKNTAPLQLLVLNYEIGDNL